MGANQNFDWHSAAASAIDWWIDAGVDATADETARDWLATPAVVAPTRAVEAVAETAPTAAPLPPTIEAFSAWRLGADAPEAAWQGTAIGAQGDPSAPLMILVDLPEREDADSGVLLSGVAGRLFERMLAAIGYDRSSVYLAALCAKRPVAGRVSPDIETRLGEIARHHVALVAPQRLLLLGNAPSRALLGADVTPTRGSLHLVNPTEVTVKSTGGTGSTEAIASFHPRFLLERPALKAEAWKDLQMLIGGLNR